MTVPAGRVVNGLQPVEGTVDVKEAPLEVRYDWQLAADQSVPLYIGTAATGTATSSPTWRIDKYTYITGPGGDPVPSRVQNATGAWDNRASLF